MSVLVVVVIMRLVAGFLEKLADGVIGRRVVLFSLATVPRGKRLGVQRATHGHDEEQRTSVACFPLFSNLSVVLW